DAGVKNADSERIVGPVRDHAAEYHTAIGVKVYKVPIGRCSEDAPNQAYAFWIRASWHAPDHLVDINVETKVVMDDLAGKACHSDRLTAGVKTLIGKLTEMAPAADFYAARKLIGALVIRIRAFGH